MTLDSKHSKDVYQGNGSTTAFPFAFKVWNTSQITVTVTDAAGVSTDVTSNSTVTLTTSGGSVTYPKTGSPLATGAKLAITRNMPFTQGINLTTASRFDPQVLEDGLDQATAERQQIQEQMARAVILPATSNESPQDVVASIYASRDAAAASASTASAQATAAQNSADMADHSAETAAQTVQMATADAVTAATTQANAAQNAAAAAAQSALDAAAAVPDTLVERVTATETKNTQQDTRLDDVESGVTAISTTLIGSIQTLLCADSYVPNGCVPANGGEYTRAQFPSLYDTYLVGGKLLTCTYAEQTAQVALTGNCAKFALDTVNQKFKVPLIKDGDSITQASSAAELGKSYKAGLPNVKGTFAFREDNVGIWAAESALSGAFYKATLPANTSSMAFAPASRDANAIGMDLSRGSSVYQNDVTTVRDEQVRLRHFVVVASAQNNASVFDWSNYMAGLAGKLNADASNADLSKFNILLQRVEYKTSDVATGTAAIPTDDTIPQITEGTQFLAKSFTPKSSTSILEIEVCVSCAQTSPTTLTVALFDGGSDAIAVMPVAMAANYMAVVTFKCVVPSSSTATRTYTVRVGDDASAQVTINGIGGVRKFGGKLYSSIRIKEYAV